MSEKFWPYLIAFAAPLIATLVFTPVVREFNRRIGMVDKPDPRRINKVPIPRGGGLAIVLGVELSYAIFHFATGCPALKGVPNVTFYKMTALAVAVALLGYADDYFSLKPKVKLLGQVIIAIGVWWWADLGFNDLWPSIPVWLDCALTVFWIVGAVNAFNLIDGLDGLASGLALIAVIGMTGSCFLMKRTETMLFYLAFAGGLFGFLRYNYHPASVFLGDSGSMYLGFVISTLPLAAHVPNSFLVSVGVPLLAMGIPIFDTSLAILRRTLRRLLSRNAVGTEGKVMSADSDHLHHRILRAMGLSQRKAAWILYAMSAACVAVGLLAMFLQSRAAGLWLAAVALAAVAVFKDSMIEFYDAGQLLNELAHTRDRRIRKRLAGLVIPFYVISDLLVLTLVYFTCAWAFGWPVDGHTLRSYLPIRVFSVFGCLIVLRVYETVWSRALESNYARLMGACILGSVAGSVFIYYWPSLQIDDIELVTLLYASLSFIALTGMRCCRGFIRNLFYAIDCTRLKSRKDVSRILVYGAGLRYRAFRRELVRTTAANERMIVGLLDDDICLMHKYIGGIRIQGTINDAPEVINQLNVDTVVIACVISDEWLDVVRKILAPTGVRITRFEIGERDVSDPAGKADA